MNIIFTIIAAPLMGWLIRSRTGAVAIFLAAQSILFTFQTLAVLLSWLAGDGGFGGATDQGAFGPFPAGLPLTFDDVDLWAYGLLNVGLMVIGVLVVISVGRLRERRMAPRVPQDELLPTAH